MKKVINRGKRSKTLSEVNPVENIIKNLQSFLEITPMQKEVLLSPKLQNMLMSMFFGLKGDNALQIISRIN